MGYLRNEQPVYSREQGLDQRLAYDVNGNAVYVGRAFPGALDSEAKWQIYKLAVDASNNTTHIRWADSTDEFIKVWDNRTSYNYVDI